MGTLKKWLDDRKFVYEFTTEKYGGNLKTVWVDRFIHDHSFFNKLGYGIRIRQ